jgi:hypothetical protein
VEGPDISMIHSGAQDIFYCTIYFSFTLPEHLSLVPAFKQKNGRCASEVIFRICVAIYKYYSNTDCEF